MINLVLNWNNNLKMVWHLPNRWALSFEEWEKREQWVNFDGKNGDGDENDDDDDEIMRNETIHDAIYGSMIKLTLVMMM